ncbi:hypothetical protein ACMYYO_11040 [Dermacoccaceae bacterium W4C1]
MSIAAAAGLVLTGAACQQAESVPPTVAAGSTPGEAPVSATTSVAATTATTTVTSTVSASSSSTAAPAGSTPGSSEPASSEPAGAAYGTIAFIHQSSAGYGVPGSLYLRTASGSLTRIAGVAANEAVQDISNDASTVLTVATSRGGSSGTLTIWDVQTTKGTRISISSDSTFQDARIVAGGVVVLFKDGTVQRYDLTGKKQSSYSGAYPSSIAVSPDGRTLYQGGPSGTTVRDLGTGAVTATLKNPAGQAVCRPFRQVGAERLSATCSESDSTASTQNRAYLLKLDGAGAPTQPIRDTQTSSGSLIPLSGGGWLYNAGEGSMDARPVYQPSSGTAADVGGQDQAITLLGGRGSSAYYLVTGQGSGAEDQGREVGILQSKDVHSGAVTTVAGTGSPLGGVVTGAVVVDGA